MLANKTKRVRKSVMIEDIKNGAFFGTSIIDACDILVISDEKNNFKLVNANLFFTLSSVDTSCNERICEYLNKNNYYKKDVEIVNSH